MTSASFIILYAVCDNSEYNEGLPRIADSKHDDIDYVLLMVLDEM